MKIIRRSIPGIVGNAAFVLTTLFIPSCSDEPSAVNSIGTQLLRTKVIVKTDTLHAVSSSSFRQFVPMNGRTNLLGRSGLSNPYLAYMMIQFYPAYIPQRDTVQILSATLSLRAVSWFGDSSANLRFNAYEMTRGWDQRTFTWDSVPGRYGSTIVSLGNPSPGGITRDTEFVSITLDTGMVRRWLQTATHAGNFGIILMPATDANVVRGFHEFDFDADSLWPRLTVIARGVSGTGTDTTVYKYGQDTFVGSIDNLVINPELVYVQSGVSYRSIMKFDCTSIPRGAIISKAELDLSYSPAGSRLNRFTADTAVAVHAALSLTDSSLFEALGARAKTSLATSDRFVLDIRHQVQNWIRNATTNHGLLVRPVNENEFSSFDLFTFFNQNAGAPSKRPQLIVVYSVESQ